MKWMLWVGMLCLSSLVVTATQTIPLLALSEQGQQSQGIVAQLMVESKPGTGRVFLDTFPLTKVTTQTSMRFAQQVACEELEKDCSRLDFFYTVKSPPGVVDGPSAGAVATVLTIAELKGMRVKKGIAMTGTINSGGAIGPVGGIVQKIEAARKNGFHTVLIPPGMTMQEYNGVPINLQEYGNETGINIVEVATVSQALTYFLPGITLPKHSKFVVDSKYLNIMKNIASTLCNNKTGKFYQHQKYYAAASECFRNRVQHARESNSSSENIKEKLDIDLRDFEASISEQSVHSITDLQTMMMVNERVRETKQALRNDSTNNLLYAQQRLLSAQLWSTFFNTDSSRQLLNMETACQEKIAQAEERYSYIVSIATPFGQPIRNTLDQAYQFFGEKDYVDCLHSAAKAKAEANAIMDVIGIKPEALKQVLQTKLEVVNQELARQQNKGSFPLIGYSYYELAESLQDQPATSLLFAEYALEFADLTTTAIASDNPQYYQYVFFGLGSIFLLIGSIMYVRNY